MTTQAAELRVKKWIDADGNERAPLRLADLGTGYKVLFCFQHWCKACHSTGFPALAKMVGALRDRGFGFAAIQTAFEGPEENTIDKLRLTQLKYGLKIPFAHDVPEETQRLTPVMLDFQTGGTPWFIVIDPNGQVIFSNFNLLADKFIALVESQGIGIRVVNGN